MAREGFYAVAIGRITGIYTTWEGGAEDQVKGFPGAKHRKFTSRQDAENYLFENGVSEPSSETQEEEEKEEEGDRAPSSETQDDDEEKDSVPSSETQEEGKDSVDELDFGALSIGGNAAASSSSHDPIASKFYERGGTPSEVKEYPDPRDPVTLVAFCSGSAPNNGSTDSRGGYAALFPHHPHLDIDNVIDDGRRATNQRADIYSVLKAMERANVEDPEQDQALFVFTNNLTLIRSMTEWIEGWRTNNWRKADGKGVENRDLFERLLLAQGTRRIVWAHVTNNTAMSAWEEEWSGRADRAARNAARGNP